MTQYDVFSNISAFAFLIVGSGYRIVRALHYITRCRLKKVANSFLKVPCTLSEIPGLKHLSSVSHFCAQVAVTRFGTCIMMLYRLVIRVSQLRIIIMHESMVFQGRLSIISMHRCGAGPSVDRAGFTIEWPEGWTTQVARNMVDISRCPHVARILQCK